MQTADGFEVEDGKPQALLAGLMMGLGENTTILNCSRLD
jgi:hypothetical protein